MNIHSGKLNSVHSEKLSSIYSEKLSGNHSEKLSSVHSEQLSSVHSEKLGSIHSEKLSSIHSEKLSSVHSEKLGSIHSEKLSSIHSEKLSSIYSEKLSGNHSEKLSSVHSEKLGSIHAEKIVFEVRRVVHKRLTPLIIRLKILNRFVLADVENLETKRSAVAAPPGDDAPASHSGTASQKAAGNVQTPQTFTAAASALLRSRAAKLRQVQKIMPQSGTKLYLKQVQNYTSDRYRTKP